MPALRWQGVPRLRLVWGGAMTDQAAARCPVCGSVGMDECERASCTWDQWQDGSRVTAKQRADGRAFAEEINALIAERDRLENEAWAAACAGLFKGDAP